MAPQGAIREVSVGFRHALLVACVLVGLGSGAAARACSSFALSGPDEVWLAKNFDWHFDGGYLIKNPRAVSRRALPLFGGEPAVWTSVHGSLTFTQYGVGLPYGGINERGLAIEMLWLDETVYPSTAPRTIGELEWIQYQLDTRASVAEVLAGVEEFSIRPVGGKIHYMLADASGDRALVEFIDGAARVHQGVDSALVCTNDTHRLSELAFKKLRVARLEGNSSRVRYARLRRELDALGGPPSVERGLAALASVAERRGRYRTQWSAVYEIRRGRVHVRPADAKRAFTIDVAALDYSAGSGTTCQDLFGKAPGDQGFRPLAASFHRELLGRNLPKVGLNEQMDEIAGHLLDPSTSTVRALDDRATLRVRVRARTPGAFARIAAFSGPRELAAEKSAQAGSVLLDTAQREFAFYNLPRGRYVVGGFHDRNQDGRRNADEPLGYFRPDSTDAASDFGHLAFELEAPRRTVELVLE